VTIHWCSGLGVRFAIANYRCHGDAKHRNRLLDPEGQKLPAQIEDDGERIGSLDARLTSNSIGELGELGSDLASAVRELQEFLKSEGERVQREIVNYAHLTETTLAAIKNIIETTFRPTARATRPRVD
jgi:gas vesicle protein